MTHQTSATVGAGGAFALVSTLKGGATAGLAAALGLTGRWG
jgi:hypothetical protein